MFAQENNKIAIVVAMVLLVGGAEAGSIVRPAPADPVLAGPPPGPCDVAAASPDYVDAIDASGHPVVPAATPSVHVLDGVALVTLPQHKRRHGEVTVGVDLAALAPPPCAPKLRR